MGYIFYTTLIVLGYCLLGFNTIIAIPLVCFMMLKICSKLSLLTLSHMHFNRLISSNHISHPWHEDTTRKEVRLVRWSDEYKDDKLNHTGERHRNIYIKDGDCLFKSDNSHVSRWVPFTERILIHYGELLALWNVRPIMSVRGFQPSNQIWKADKQTLIYFNTISHMTMSDYKAFLKKALRHWYVASSIDLPTEFIDNEIEYLAGWHKSDFVEIINKLEPQLASKDIDRLWLGIKLKGLDYRPFRLLIYQHHLTPNKIARFYVIKPQTVEISYAGRSKFTPMRDAIMVYKYAKWCLYNFGQPVVPRNLSNMLWLMITPPHLYLDVWLKEYDWQKYDSLENKALAYSYSSSLIDYRTNKNYSHGYLVTNFTQYHNTKDFMYQEFSTHFWYILVTITFPVIQTLTSWGFQSPVVKQLELFNQNYERPVYYIGRRMSNKLLAAIINKPFSSTYNLYNIISHSQIIQSQNKYFKTWKKDYSWGEFFTHIIKILFLYLEQVKSLWYLFKHSIDPIVIQYLKWMIMTVSSVFLLNYLRQIKLI